MVLKEFIQKRLREQEKDASDIEKELKKNYPHLMDLYSKGNARGLLKGVSQYQGKNKEKIKEDTPYHKMYGRVIDYVKGKKGADPLLKAYIEGSKEWPPDPMFQKEMKNLDEFVETFLYEEPDPQQWREEMEMEYPNIAKLDLRKQELMNKAEEERKMNSKKAIQYISNEVKGATHGNKLPFDIEKAMDTFRQGTEFGPFTLSKGQADRLKSEDEKMRDIFENNSNIEITDDGYEVVKHKLQYGSPAGGGSKTKDFDQAEVWPEKERAREKRYNKDEVIDREIKETIDAYWKRNNGPPAPEAHQKDFEIFYEYLKRLATEIGNDVFTHMSSESEENVRQSLQNYWDGNIKTQE